MLNTGVPVGLDHPLLGDCRLLRVEGMNWVVEVNGTGTQLRIPVTRRPEFTLRDGQQAAPEPAAAAQGSGSSDGKASLGAPQMRLRRAIESLRNGLPPAGAEAHKLTVGFEKLEGKVRELLHQVDNEGGAVKTVRGGYGHGKTLALNLAADLAVESGFWVVQTEVDASEIRLDKPRNVYRSLLRSLRIPGAHHRGTGELAARVQALTKKMVGVDANHYYPNIRGVQRWLEEKLGCPPLAWLFCDPEFANKEKLRGLLEGDHGWSIGDCRNRHIFPGDTRDWPAFSAGTQGDFACFLLSGIGRLAKLLGDRGLVIFLDEMEKWQDLSWTQQTRAGNLIGGLIWGATERVGRRERSTLQRKNIYQPEKLEHSGRAGGFPFTTLSRSHVGLVIALTPRGYEGPEELWKQFGPVDIFDLPEFTEERFRTYVGGVGAYYAAAYELPAPDVTKIFCRARSLWREVGDEATRSAVRATIQALDEWRESPGQ